MSWTVVYVSSYKGLSNVGLSTDIMNVVFPVRCSSKVTPKYFALETFCIKCNNCT